MLEAHHHEETEMPRSTAIQSERTRRSLAARIHFARQLQSTFPGFPARWT
jgi:hypothetical protein